MGNLAKIREISVKYNISARTLRYYEDMGLIESTRTIRYCRVAAVVRTGNLQFNVFGFFVQQLYICFSFKVQLSDAVAVSMDGDDESGNKVMQKVEKWLEKTNFVIDESRAASVHMIYVDDEIKEGLGYHQLNLYAPIKRKDNC